jgi:hypothetical protein
MTRLGRASAFLAVFAGDYAILMLINGQTTDFDVSAGVCAGALSGPRSVRVCRQAKPQDARAWTRSRVRTSRPGDVDDEPLPAAHFLRRGGQSQEVWDSGVIGVRPCRVPRGLEDRDRATGSRPDSDEWRPAETALATTPVDGHVHDR